MVNRLCFAVMLFSAPQKMMFNKLLLEKKIAETGNCQ